MGLNFAAFDKVDRRVENDLVAEPDSSKVWKRRAWKQPRSPITKKPLIRLYRMPIIRHRQAQAELRRISMVSILFTVTRKPLCLR